MKHAVACACSRSHTPHKLHAASQEAGESGKAEPEPSAQRRCVPAVSEAQPGWRAPSAASARG
eukprot:1395937-Prymnesium_polylepis.1